MKHKIATLFTLIITLICSAFCLFACEKQEGAVKASVVESNDTLLVIRIEETDGNATLYDVMKYLQDEGKITFESQSSTYGEMLEGINGKANDNGAGAYWMAYTTDTEEGFSNAAWGVYEYGGQTFNSNALGMSSMIVKKDCLYAWVYQSY